MRSVAIKLGIECIRQVLVCHPLEFFIHLQSRKGKKNSTVTINYFAITLLKRHLRGYRINKLRLVDLTILDYVRSQKCPKSSFQKGT